MLSVKGLLHLIILGLKDLLILHLQNNEEIKLFTLNATLTKKFWKLKLIRLQKKNINVIFRKLNKLKYCSKLFKVGTKSKILYNIVQMLNLFNLKIKKNA